jgi:hypothetical protein
MANRLTILMLFLVLLGLPLVNATDFTTNLTNLFTFNIDANDTVNNSITPISNDAAWINAKIGKAYDCSGSKKIVYSQGNILNFGSSDFTIILWTNMTSYTAGFRHISAGYDGAHTTSTGLGNPWGGTAKMEFYHNGGTDLPSGEVSSFFPLNIWHQMAYVRQSGTIRFYIDGVNFFNGSFADTISPTYKFSVCARQAAQDSWTEYISGAVDEVAIYKNRAFTNSEINDSYVCGLNNQSLNNCGSIPLNITIFHPINNSQTLDTSEQFNFTCDKSGTIKQYINGVINYTNSSYINNTLISRTLNLSYGNYNTTIECINGTNTLNQTIYFSLISQLLNQSYTNYSQEQNKTSFFFEVQNINTISNVSALLYYNGQPYTPTYELDTHEGAHFHFNYTKLVPFVSVNNTKIPFYWNYTIYYTNGSNFTNITATINQTVKTIDYTFLYANYTAYGANNYTRNLSYAFTPTCENSFNLTAIINNNITRSSVIMCGATNTRYYTHNAEGAYNISILLVSENNKTINNASFISDLNSPTIQLLNYTITSGFVAPNITVNLICNDTIMPFLYYNLSVNQVSLYYINLTTATLLTNKTIMNNGANNVTGFCFDTFSSVTQTLTPSIYYNTLTLIDEKNNTPLSLTNFTTVRLYFDDNSSYFDFKTAAVTAVNFTNVNNTKLRLELVYPDTSVITRYLDTSLLPVSEQNVKLCGNPYGTTHYEQLFTSTTQKAAFVKNAYSNCYILADKTRFAYQNTLVVKGFTISALYYLYVLDENNRQTLLASLDGSIQTFINLDTLEFNKKGYNLAVNTDVLTFNQYSNTSIKIYYLNQKDDNTALNVSIYRLDTGASVFNTDSFTDPNEFTLYFDYTTLNVTNSSLFKIDVTKYKADGSSSTISQYLNQKGGTGGLSNGVAAMISALLVVFGLTLASSKVTYSWLGIFVMIIAIAVLVFAVGGVWWITFLQAIYLIILVFIVILMANQNYNTVA